MGRSANLASHISFTELMVVTRNCSTLQKSFMSQLRAMIIVVIILIVQQLQAGGNSPQSPDMLFYNGDTVGIFELMIDPIVDELRESEGSLFGLEFRQGGNFNCWKGYQAVYQIRDEELHLLALLQCGGYDRWASGDTLVQQENLFKEIITILGGTRIPYSGSIYVRTSNQLVRWDGVFDRVYKEENQLVIENGKLIRKVKVKNYVDVNGAINRLKKDSISTLFFQRWIHLDWEALDEIDCADSYAITINSSGKVKSIRFTGWAKEDLKILWDRNEYKKCYKELLSAIKDYRFDEVYWHGKKFDDEIFIEVFYDQGVLEDWSN